MLRQSLRIPYILINIIGCLSIAEYEIFPGFDTDYNASETDTTIPFNISGNQTSSLMKNSSDEYIIFKNSTLLQTMAETLTPMSNESILCPEEEKPTNLGPYEVPTERDLLMMVRKTLRIMFRAYQEKALLFLEDIIKAKRVTKDVEMKCQGDKLTYRKCIKEVSLQCATITKNFVTTMYAQQEEFSKTAVCSLSALKDDPMRLIKILAMEQASIEFALPGFLRLLNGCSKYCDREFSKHNLSDIDLVVNYFLAKHNNYNSLFAGKKLIKPKIHKKPNKKNNKSLHLQ